MADQTEQTPQRSKKKSRKFYLQEARNALIVLGIMSLPSTIFVSAAFQRIIELGGGGVDGRYDQALQAGFREFLVMLENSDPSSLPTVVGFYLLVLASVGIPTTLYASSSVKAAQLKDDAEKRC